MTLDEIVDMCDRVLTAKAHEYATPEERWHNFIMANTLAKDFKEYEVLDLSPLQCVCAFALKHYVSCMDFVTGAKPRIPELVKEKAGDLLNYYLIYRCLKEGLVVPKTNQWLTELVYVNKRWEAKPWIVGFELLEMI